jgi:hypothetical protein
MVNRRLAIRGGHFANGSRSIGSPTRRQQPIAIRADGTRHLLALLLTFGQAILLDAMAVTVDPSRVGVLA